MARVIMSALILAFLPTVALARGSGNCDLSICYGLVFLILSFASLGSALSFVCGLFTLNGEMLVGGLVSGGISLFFWAGILGWIG
ncbi:MAG: hypothetical protein V2I43_19480 [Parvularcula sp.]|jgi:hypothetical protein|nr:hypothetical protein [Parvularcula sp.]